MRSIILPPRAAGEYNVRVRPYNAAGYGAWSNSVPFVLQNGILIPDTVPEYYNYDTVPATLWVNQDTGNDSYTYEQVANSGGSLQWATIARAAWGSTSYASPNTSQAAQPGDVVDISAGTYWEGGPSSGHRFSVSLNPANSGTEGNPIIFRGHPTGRTEIRQNEGIRGGLIGANTRNYVFWHRVYVDDTYCGSTSDTGPIVFTGDCQHCRFTGSRLRGHNGSYHWGYSTFGGNYRGVSLEPAHNTVIADNVIDRFWPHPDPTTAGQNEAGIMAYDSNDNIAEHNHIYDCGVAIFIKGLHPGNTQDGNIARLNLIEQASAYTRQGIRFLSSTNGLAYQNLIIGCDPGLWAGFFESENTRYVNNTLVGGPVGFIPQGTDLINVLSQNNLFYNVVDPNYFWDGSTPPNNQDVVYLRNLYHGYTRIWRTDGGNYSTLSAWQATGRDANSISADPLFVDAGAGDYHLQSGSPALTLGRDILNLLGEGTGTVIPAGCYITGDEIIGPRIAVPA